MDDLSVDEIDTKENKKNRKVFSEIGKIYKKITALEYSYLAWAFIIPLILYWIIFIFMEVYPFGENSVLVLDLNGQYVSFFEALRNWVYKGGNLLYTWERALGGEFMGIIAYYIASPLSLIVALFPKAMITEALLCLLLVKCGGCGAAMAWYLHKKTPPETRRRLDIILFSTMYALTAYALVYSHNTMWIDELIILPFLTYGIEKLISERRYKMFTVSLALALFVNFYIGYMMCIYTALYFFYYYILKNNKEKENNVCAEKLHFLKTLGRIVFFSIIAVSIASVILLPTYHSLTFGKTTFTEPKYTPELRFDFLDIFIKMFPGTYDTVRPEGLPWLYCGVLSLILLPVYFLASGIKLREKIMACGMMLIFILSMNISAADIVWHGLQKPNWLNNRYSFMLGFLMIFYAYRAFKQLAGLDFKWVASVGGILVAVVMFIQKFEYGFLDGYKFALTSVISIICILIGLYLVSRQTLKYYGTVILTVMVCIELVIAGVFNITSLDADVGFTTRTYYAAYMKRVSPIINSIKESDKSFYRMEKALYRKTNDPMAFGFKGLSNSTSTLNKSVINLLNQMGLSAKSHWSKYIGGNPVTDSLLGLKYIVYPEITYQDRYYDPYLVDGANELYAYKNPYAASVAYAVSGDIKDFDINLSHNPCVVLNALVGTMLGETDVELFKKITVSDIDYINCDVSFVTEHKKYTPASENRDAMIIITFTAAVGDEIFLTVPTKYPRELKVTVNGEDKGTILGNDTDCLVSLGAFEPGEEVTLNLRLVENEVYIMNGSSYIYYIDTELFKITMPRLLESEYEIKEFSNTRLYGTVNAAAGRSVLFTTIPYDSGWKVWIDGESTQTYETLDSLLAVDIGEGTHEAEFRYDPIEFRVGLILCGSAAVIFAAVCTLDFLFKRRTRKINEQFIDNHVIV